MDVKSKPAKNQQEHVFMGSNGIKYIVRETFSDDKGKNLQDILVNQMLTDSTKQDNNR